MNMYWALQVAVCSLLITWLECRPAERAETSRKSPVDAIYDVKEAVGYNLVQRRLIDSQQPKPVVDTLKEEEKYGNVGEHPIGRAVVKGYAGVSNIVNSAFAFPRDAARQTTNILIGILDDFGGRFVGLQ